MHDTRAEQLESRPIKDKNIQAGSWYSIPIVEDQNPLMPIGPYSQSFEGSHELFTMGVYFGEYPNSPYINSRPHGALLGMYLREEAGKQLVEMQRNLPEEYIFVIFDAYRDYSTQKSLHDKYLQTLKNHHPDWSEEQLMTATEPFVAAPSGDPQKPSAHNTGGTVDLALFHVKHDTAQKRHELLKHIATMEPDDIYRAREEEKLAQLLLNEGKIIDYGAAFDETSDRGETRYYEEHPGVSYRNNRRFFTHTMQQNNFEVLESEWWHFSHTKTQSGARYAGKTEAHWGPATFDETCVQHEKLRLKRYRDKTSTAKYPKDSLGNYPVHGISPAS